MRMKTTLLGTLIVGGSAVSPVAAEVFTLPDITRAANEGVVDIHYNFDPNSGWSGSPPNQISGEDALFLKFTVNWEPNSNIGSFNVDFNRNDNGGAGRWGVRTEGSGFSFGTGNRSQDVDGPNGPGTAKPSITPVDKTQVTSATFVLKVDQTVASTRPADYAGQLLFGGSNNPDYDRWYGDTTTPGAQDEAAGFLYINPDLTMPESTQSTEWAAWRSSNDSYQSVSFRTDTAGTALSFTDIALYIGDDTPFGAATVIPSPSAFLVGAIGLGFTALRRRRG